MSVLTIDGVDVILGGQIHGECFDLDETHRCAGAWVLDDFAVMMYVEFESADSQKDPSTAVARLLASHVPALLATAETLAAASS